MSQCPNALDPWSSPKASLQVDLLKHAIDKNNDDISEDRLSNALTAVDAMLAYVHQKVFSTACLERAMARALSEDYAGAMHDVNTVIDRLPTLGDGYVCAARIAYLYGDLRGAWLHYRRGIETADRQLPGFDPLVSVGEALWAQISRHNTWTLPYDIVSAVIHFLPFNDRIELAATCKHWQELVLSCPQTWRSINLQGGVKSAWWSDWLRARMSLIPTHYIRHVTVTDKLTLKDIANRLRDLECLVLGRLENGGETGHEDTIWGFTRQKETAWWDTVAVTDFLCSREHHSQLRSITTASGSCITFRAFYKMLMANPKLQILTATLVPFLEPTPEPDNVETAPTTLSLCRLMLVDVPLTTGVGTILERSPNLESLTCVALTGLPQRGRIGLRCEQVARLVSQHCPKIKHLCYWLDRRRWYSAEKALYSNSNSLIYSDESDTGAETHLLDITKRLQSTLQVIAFDCITPNWQFLRFLGQKSLPQLTTLRLHGRMRNLTSSNNDPSWIHSSVVARVIGKHSHLRDVALEKICDLEKPVLEAIARLPELESVSLGFFYVSLPDRKADLLELLDRTRATLKRFRLHVGISNINTLDFFCLVNAHNHLTHLGCGTDLDMTLEGISNVVRTGPSTAYPIRRAQELTSLVLHAPTGGLSFMDFEPVSDLGLLPKLEYFEAVNAAGRRLSSTAMTSLVSNGGGRIRALVAYASRIEEYPESD